MPFSARWLINHHVRLDDARTRVGRVKNAGSTFHHGELAAMPIWNRSACHAMLSPHKA
jgi:hypothetical protein